ncbi:MAG: hypothetical protein KAY59_08950, partial [Acidobacteria bacterium]|nr:hypothetical protein [Acidobacteriota bacterium]
LMPTPVDLSAYTAARTQEEERRVVNGGSVIVVRRPLIDMPSVASASSGTSSMTPARSSASIAMPLHSSSAATAVADAPASEASAISLDFAIEGDEPSPLDVPAFLRRKES